MAFKRSFKRKRTMRKRPAPRRARKVMRKPLRKAVRAVVRSMAEKKSVQAYNLGQVVRAVNSASFDATIVQVSPCATNGAINQGTSAAARIGNRIQLTKCYMKGTVVAAGYDPTVNPVPIPTQVTIFWFYDKTLGPNVLPAPAAAQDFYQFGGTDSGFSNDLIDQWAPINTDKYTVVARRQFKVGQAIYDGTGATPAQQFFTNNDFKYNVNFKINLLPHMVKRVVYNDNTSDPSTRSLYMMIVPSRADGGGLGSAIIPCALQYIIDYEYIDL